MSAAHLVFCLAIVFAAEAANEEEALRLEAGEALGRDEGEVIGEDAEVGRRAAAAFLSASGSFTLSSNRAGNDEALSLGDAEHTPGKKMAKEHDDKLGGLSPVSDSSQKSAQPRTLLEEVRVLLKARNKKNKMASGAEAPCGEACKAGHAAAVKLASTIQGPNPGMAPCKATNSVAKLCEPPAWRRSWAGLGTNMWKCKKLLSRYSFKGKAERGHRCKAVVARNHAKFPDLTEYGKRPKDVSNQAKYRSVVRPSEFQHKWWQTCDVLECSECKLGMNTDPNTGKCYSTNTSMCGEATAQCKIVNAFYATDVKQNQKTIIPSTRKMISAYINSIETDEIKGTPYEKKLAAAGALPRCDQLPVRRRRCSFDAARGVFTRRRRGLSSHRTRHWFQFVLWKHTSCLGNSSGASSNCQSSKTCSCVSCKAQLGTRKCSCDRMPASVLAAFKRSCAQM